MLPRTNVGHHLTPNNLLHPCMEGFWLRHLTLKAEPGPKHGSCTMALIRNVRWSRKHGRLPPSSSPNRHRIFGSVLMFLFISYTRVLGEGGVQRRKWHRGGLLLFTTTDGKCEHVHQAPVAVSLRRLWVRLRSDNEEQVKHPESVSIIPIFLLIWRPSPVRRQ